MFDLVLAGFVLLAVGVVVILASMVLSYRRGETKIQGGGVVLVGPIPIIFGSDAKWASLAVALAIVLVVLSLLYYLG